MYKFCYDHVKPKYEEKANYLTIMLQGYSSFVVYVKAKDIYIDIPKGVEKRHNISSYEKDHRLKEKIKKVNGLIKDKIVGKIMTDFAALIPETFGYSIDDNDDKINAKGTKKCVMK